MSERHCETCTCGQIEVSWSDRSQYIFPEPEAMAELIVNWALDHEYDRGANLPHGLPDLVQRRALPVVVRHLSALQPDWARYTVYMSGVQRQALLDDLLVALKL